MNRSRERSRVVTERIRIRVRHGLPLGESRCVAHTIELTAPKTRSVAWVRRVAKALLAEKAPHCLDSIDWSTLEESDHG
jgi:hypothetical protein